MSSRFKILGSSSKGNCTFLQAGEVRILIDAGFSGKRICQMLETAGERIEDINAIFLSHEHADHAQGIRGLATSLAIHGNAPIFANQDTADAVQSKLQKPANWKLFETGTTFRFLDLEIRSFALPHDAYDPAGFVFSWGHHGDPPNPSLPAVQSGGSLAWVTDLGYMPEHVREHIRTVETLIIEANYDETLLDRDKKRPWSLKQRIRGRHGHLSNEQTFDILDQLNDSKVREVYLAHLSRDCNSVDLVRKRFARLSSKNFTIKIIDPESGTPVPIH